MLVARRREDKVIRPRWQRVALALTWVLLAWVTSSGWAQQQETTRQNQDLLRAAQLWLKAGNLNAAEKAYLRILKQDSQVVEAWRGLGRIAARRRQWNKAADWFGKVVKRRPNDLEAHYYLGIHKRESGKFKGLVLRLLDFRSSEKHFKKVIQQDSLYADVWYQYALLERYRTHYLKAIDLTRKQLRLKPNLVEPRLKLYRFYDLFVENNDSTTVFAELDSSYGALGSFFKAEKLRRLGHLDSAKAIFDRLLENGRGVSKTAVYLHLARIAFEKGQNDVGEWNYWQAIRHIRDNVDAGLAFNDVKYILTDEEYERYRNLAFVAQKRLFFTQIWKKRDPFPASRDNPRLAEHYHRLIFAERWYRQDEPHRPFHQLDLEWRGTPKVFALNEEFNEKGLVYIRWGEPDDKAVFSHPGYPTYESWIYKKTVNQPQVIVHFANAEDSSPTDWRITVLPPPEVVWDMNLETWDVRYHSYVAARSQVEQLALANEIDQELRKGRRQLLTQERMVFPDTVELLPASFYWATMRGRGDSVQLNFYYGLAFKDAFSKRDRVGLRRNFESGLALFDTLWTERARRVRFFTLERPPRMNRALAADAQMLQLPGGIYNLTFYIRDEARKRMGSWRYRDTLRVYEPGRLAMSDLTVAVNIDPAIPVVPGRFRRHGVVIAPNPTRSFRRKQPIFVYFEIYGLRRDKSGVAHCRVTYTLIPGKPTRTGFLGLFGPKLGSVSVTNEFDPPSSDYPVYTALDASRFPTGRLKLKVAVTDLVRNATVAKSIPLLLVKD